MDNSTSDLVTISAGVVLLAVMGAPMSATTLRRLADSGRLPMIRANGGLRLFRRGDIEALAIARRDRAAAGA